MKRILAGFVFLALAVGGVTWAVDSTNVGTSLFGTLADGTKIPAIVGVTTDGNGAILTLGSSASAADVTNIGQNLYATLTGIGKVPAVLIYTTDGAGTPMPFTALKDSKSILNCAIASSVGSSALTIAIKDAAGNDPSAASPCKISFRDATITTWGYTQVSLTTGAAVVASNGSALGCTASSQCLLNVYAINNAGTIVLGVMNGYALDESILQSSTAEGGAGAADSIQTLYSTSAQSSKAVRLLGRILVTPAGSFAWTNAPAEISNPPIVSTPWYINAYFTGANPSLGIAAVTTYTEIIDAGLTLTPILGSAAVGTMCSTTNAAMAPSTGNTTCGAGSESLGISFTLPSPGIYKVCVNASWSGTNDAAEALNPAFELIETPTSAQTLTLESGARVTIQTVGAAAAQVSGSIVSVCGIFNWTTVTAGTVKGVRLMFEQSITGAPNASAMQCDENTNNGQRNCNFTAERM